MKKILIVGLGLLGGSYAKGLHQKGHQVTAIDPQKSSIDFAVAEGFLQAGWTVPNPEAITAAEVIIFGLYPDLMLDWVEKYQEFFQSGVVITDVCGVKSQIVAGMDQILRKDAHYVGAHPMAGREVSGVENADHTMFRNANFILTPTEKTDPKAQAVVEDLARDLEFLRISYLSPEDHDRAIGFLSQLTHVIAVSLMNCQNNEEYIKYTGDSFRDLTRIAMINEALWGQLFLGNKEILLEQIDCFAEELQAFRGLLAADDLDGMKEKFVTSTERRKKYQSNQTKKT